MDFLISIGPINIDITMLISFLIGISFGFILLFLIYIYAVIKSINKKSHFRKVDEPDIDEEEIKYLIEDAQAQFKDKDLRNEVGFEKLLKQITGELTVDIASKFYPQSKYPYLELTVDETILLARYVTNRLDEVLSGRILRLTRAMTLAKIMELNQVKSRIDDSKIVQTAKKYSKVTKTAMAVINAVNPVYWFRKLTQETAINIIMVRIGLALIAITGEETYKIYSKKVFATEKTIDTGVDDIYTELTKDFKDAGDET